MSNLNAGIIVIGNEILSGRTLDTNSNFISKKLIESGIKLDQIRVIQDNEIEIINTVCEFSKKYTYVFTTGGIGPTHDDITSESVSKAFNRKYEINSVAYNILKEYYPKGEFNEGRQKMAKMPENVELILNPETAAPGFVIKNVYILPGVPEIMRSMISNVLKNIKKGKPIKTLTLNVNLYESLIASDLMLIQKNNPKCSIGSYPYFHKDSKSGGVNIVISSWSLDTLDPILEEIKKMINLLGGNWSIVCE